MPTDSQSRVFRTTWHCRCVIPLLGPAIAVVLALAAVDVTVANPFSSSPEPTANPGFGGPGSVPAFDTGWYDSSGVHEPTNPNYAVGAEGTTIYRNFFAFDLSLSPGNATAATLRVFNPLGGYVSTDPTEVIAFSDVTTSIAALIDGTGGLPAFDDLGAGIQYGSTVVSVADDDQVVEIQLNAAALASINAASGNWALGGNLTSLNAADDIEAVFGFTNSSAGVELVLRFVPEPTSALLVGLGCVTLVACRQRSRVEVTT